MSMKKPLLLAVPLLAVLLSGCIARTAANIVTLPVRAGGQVVDWSTTSQDEADRNRGRDMRKQEKREVKERRRACREAGYDDCG
jgi:hypothetical protein